MNGQAGSCQETSSTKRRIQHIVCEKRHFGDRCSGAGRAVGGACVWTILSNEMIFDLDIRC